MTSVCSLCISSGTISSWLELVYDNHMVKIINLLVWSYSNGLAGLVELKGKVEQLINKKHNNYNALERHIHEDTLCISPAPRIFCDLKCFFLSQ